MHKLYLRIWLKIDIKDLCERVAYRGAMVHSQSESQIPDTKKHGPIGEPGWHPRWPFDLLHNLLTGCYKTRVFLTLVTAQHTKRNNILWQISGKSPFPMIIRP